MDSLTRLRRSASSALAVTSAAPLAFSAHHHSGPGPESPLAKFLIGGGVTILFELFGGHTIEMLKILKQTNTESYLQLFKRITAKKGIAGALDGFAPWGLLQALAKGSVFAFGQAQSAALLHNVTWMSKEQKTVATGALGGLVQGIVLSPVLLLKTRVMTDPSFRGTGGLFATAVASAKVGTRVIKTEGVGALMKGAGVFSLKRALDWASRYLFVVMVEEAMKSNKNQKLSEGQVMAASLIGGSLSALATIPMDVLVATMQQASKAGTKVSVFDTFREQMKAGGIGSIVAFSTRGLMARVVHVALTTMMMKNITSFVYEALYANKGEKAASKKA